VGLRHHTSSHLNSNCKPLFLTFFYTFISHAARLSCVIVFDVASKRYFHLSPVTRVYSQHSATMSTSSSAQVPEHKPSEDANPPPGTYSPTPRRPIYQTETTGSYWTDVREAFKRLSPTDDLQRVGEIPCARNSLLSGIASGVGVGVIRGLSVHPFVASNWAVGTFMLVSLGTWTICQRNILEERRRVQTVVEQLPQRMLAKPKDSESPP